MARARATGGNQPADNPAFSKNKLFTIGRVLFAITAGTLGVLHFIYFPFAPNIEPISMIVKVLIPAQPIWSYFTGFAFLAAAAAIFLSSKIRLAATLLGVVVLLFALIVWVPWLAAHPQDIAGGNCLKDMGLAGGALLLAGALATKDG
ncbi:hypothetical protein [Alloacidobacterium sp.]|uniref:hypothetical protein n=1 Tax=Alloacidobacterium sp. TaxID=2951999 RepID=UPI002D48FD2A|nr:hypothetical protein [Alloacidobacterium sp.]HYK34436.1 hypothetical protein [Alloacidobacterium sp.]